MNGRTFVIAGLIAFGLSGLPSTAPGVVLQVKTRSFVLDSTKAQKLSTSPGIVAFHPQLTKAVELSPALAGQQLIAQEVRVQRMSPVAERPQIRSGMLQWRVPLEIQARDKMGITHVMVPRMQMLDQGLLWNGELSRYLGKVRVWLEDKVAPASGYALESPVALEIGGEASSFAPARWDVPRVGLPSQDVDIAVAGARAADSIQILVAATSSSQQATLEASTAALKVPLSGTAIAIRPPRQSLQGWGLEAGEVTIQTAASTAEKPLVASLTCAEGRPRAQTVAIGTDGIAVARVRSGAPGMDTVWVSIEGRNPRYALIDYRWPLMFLAWALGGGLLGSLLRNLGQSPDAAKTKRPRLGTQVAVGILCGILTTGLYVVGFPVLPALAQGQSGGAVTGVLAAVGAFLGRDWLAGMLGDKKTN
jgi:hypothetical protein